VKKTAPEGRFLKILFFGRLNLEDLATAIHPSLKIYMMRAPQFTRILVLDIGRGFKRIRRATEASLHRRGFSLWNSHLSHSSALGSAKRAACENFMMRAITPIKGG